MAKRGIALAAAAVAVLSGWSVPAHAAGEISAVTLGWEAGKVKVTWTETAPTANTVTLSTGQELGTTTADDPNELLVAPTAVGLSADAADSVRIQVSDGAAASAASAAFDRYLPQPAKIATALVDPDESVRWSLPAASADETPGDPLDVANGTTYAVKVYEFGTSPGSCVVTPVADSTALTGDIARRAKPYTIQAKPSNEWGSVAFGKEARAAVRYSVAQLSTPAPAPYGTTWVATAGYGVASVGAETPYQCLGFTVHGETRGPVTIEGRADANSPWSLVKTIPSGSSGAYRASLTNLGRYEYRVVRPTERNADGTFVYGDTSDPVVARSITRVVDAKFITPVIPLGTQPQAYLRVDPEGSQQAALQWKNTSGVWQGISYKTLASGRGLLTFPFNRRGTAEFRWWTPGMTLPSGLTVEATYSSVFTLTVQ